MRHNWSMFALVAATVVGGIGGFGEPAGIFSAQVARADVTVTVVVTRKEAQADFDAGKYPECLQKITAILAASPRPTPAEKAAVLDLKAECFMQQKQLTPASDAFTAAATAYEATKKPEDKKNAAVDTATADLIKQSDNMVYTPKTVVDKNGVTKLVTDKSVKDMIPPPIGIVDRSSRPAALKALFNDEYFTEQAAFKALQGKAVLDSLVDFAPKMIDLSALELAATGANAKTDVMQKAYATETKTAIDGAITRMHSNVDGIASGAAAMVADPVQPAQGKKGRTAARKQHERGLTETDRTTLNTYLADVDKIPPAIKAIAPAVPVETDHFKTEVTKTAALKKKIEAVLGGKFKTKG